jgi:DNA-binding MarR family transcriptional regulator
MRRWSAALTASTVVWTWAQRAGLRLDDAHVLLALADMGGPVPATDITTRCGFSLDLVYPALHRLTDRGYVYEEQRRHGLTDEGHKLIADLDRAEQNDPICPHNEPIAPGDDPPINPTPFDDWRSHSPA